MRLCLPWHFDTVFLLKAASLGQTPKACCFCLFVQGFYVDGFGVLNGSPLEFAEHSSCADRRPGEDIQGEAEGAEDLLPGSRPDALPLGNQRPGGQQEGRAVGACQQGQDQDACSAEAALQKCSDQADASAQDAQHIAVEGKGQGLEGGVSGTAAGDQALGVFLGIAEGDLDAALTPAGALPPGLAEGLGLLIKENGIVAVANADAPHGAPGAELDILGQSKVVPVVHFLQQFSSKAEAGTGDGAGKAQPVTGLI